MHDTLLFDQHDRMFSTLNQPLPCTECERNNDGWFICAECHRIFCSRHSIEHRHQPREDQATSERYNRYVHLDQIAEWERKAIDKIRKQADEARRPLVAPPTPMTQTASPSTVQFDEFRSSPLSQLFTASSNSKSQSLTLNPYELISDETLNEIIGDGPSTAPPGETSTPGRVSFISPYPYTTGLHRLRLFVSKFVQPVSWAFIGIVSEKCTTPHNENPTHTNRSSFGWHLGRKSIIYNRQVTTHRGYDGRDTHAGDTIAITLDCSRHTIEISNETMQNYHIIHVPRTDCPLPWLFAANFNYGTGKNDSLYLLR